MSDPPAGQVFRDLRYHIFTCDEAGDFCGCEASGGREFRETLRTVLARRGLARFVKTTITTCNQPNARGPVTIVHPDGVWYDGLTVDDIPRFIDEHLIHGRVLDDKLFSGPIVTGAFAYTRESHGAGAQRSGPPMATDLVCHMSVPVPSARHTIEYNGRAYYFCGPACKKLFAASPEQYVLA